MNDHTQPEYPKITIITPSLNQGQFIEATIQSVLSQGYPNLEYIIVDGGSTDNTLDILRSYSGRLQWFSEKDNGQTSAINKGLRLASGQIMAYLNADDLYLPGTLEKVAKKFMEKPDAMWVTGKCRIIDVKDQEIRKLITAYKNFYLRVNIPSLLLITDYISQPATFWRAEVFKTVGPFHEDFHYAMDYEYWLKLSTGHPLVIIPEYLAAFRIHSHSKNTTAGHRNDYIDEERVIIEGYTKSRLFKLLHTLHRWLMTTVYSILNR